MCRSSTNCSVAGIFPWLAAPRPPPGGAGPIHSATCARVHWAHRLSPARRANDHPHMDMGYTRAWQWGSPPRGRLPAQAPALVQELRAVVHAATVLHLRMHQVQPTFPAAVPDAGRRCPPSPTRASAARPCLPPAYLISSSPPRPCHPLPAPRWRPPPRLPPRQRRAPPPAPPRHRRARRCRRRMRRCRRCRCLPARRRWPCRPPRRRRRRCPRRPRRRCSAGLRRICARDATVDRRQGWVGVSRGGTRGSGGAGGTTGPPSFHDDCGRAGEGGAASALVAPSLRGMARWGEV